MLLSLSTMLIYIQQLLNIKHQSKSGTLLNANIQMMTIIQFKYIENNQINTWERKREKK